MCRRGWNQADDDVFTVEVLVRMGDIQGVHVDSKLFTVNLGVTNGEVLV